jgi:zinc transporter, ZIP family
MTEHAVEWSGVMLRAGMPVAAALAGGIAGAFGASRERAVIGPLVHFAAGAFLGIALIHLLPEAIQHAGWWALIPLVAGWGVAAALTRWSGASCPACEGSHAPAVPLQFGFPLLGILALHSILDGVALGASDGHHHSAELLSAAVVIHKLPEGLAIAAVCRASGRSMPSALAITFGIQAFTFVGAAGAMLLGLTAGRGLGLALGAVAGSFLYLVTFTFFYVRSTASRFWNAALGGAGTLSVVLARLTLG